MSNLICPNCHKFTLQLQSIIQFPEQLEEEVSYKCTACEKTCYKWADIQGQDRHDMRIATEMLREERGE